MLKIKAPGLLLKDEAFKKVILKSSIKDIFSLFWGRGAGETEGEGEGERERAKGKY